MRKLGLIGGMGPESTIPYYHDIVYGVKERVGREFFPNITVESINVFEVLGLCGEGKYDELTEYLLKAIECLYKSGADFAALAANTPHIVFDRLKERSPLPLISIVEACSEEAKRRGFKKLGLLGTVFTMNGEFFKKPFIQSGIEIVVPDNDDMRFVNEKISKELENGIIKPETQKAFQNLIAKMKGQSDIEAVILGCTELPLILNDEVSPVACLDTMQIHIKAIVYEILKD